MKNNTRHTEILAVAAELFFTSGYKNTHMLAIAQQAGISKGLMYFYYKNKDDLFLAVLEHALQLNLDLVQSTLAGKQYKNGLAKAMELLESFLTLSTETLFFQEMIIQTMQLTASEPDPSLTQKLGISDDVLTNSRLDAIRELQVSIYETVKKAIVEGQDDGSILTQSTPAEIYLSIWSFIIGFDTMMPIMKNHQRSNAEPKQEYLLIDINRWKQYIIGFCRMILLNRK